MASIVAEKSELMITAKTNTYYSATLILGQLLCKKYELTRSSELFPICYLHLQSLLTTTKITSRTLIR